MSRDDAANEPNEQRHTVLNVFGLTLEVSNPRLAELLTMDAREALAADVKDLFGGSGQSAAAAALDTDLVDVLPQPDARTAYEEAARKESRDRVVAIGERLGFSVRQDGSWVSPTGIVVLVRDLAGSTTLAAAAHFVEQLQEVLAHDAQPDRSSVLFVTRNHDAAEVLTVAIRQARAYSTMRVACLDDLEDLARMVALGRAHHEQALAVVAPIAAIDVAEIVAVLRAAEAGAHAERTDQ
ncbi:MAG: hypothetical protein QMD76_06505 [Anaerosomatales bacterium]|nr:hypothetical protein [Anaerosomatales bacterium]